MTDREKKILEVFILNLCAQSNSVVTGKNMVINPPIGKGLFNSDLMHEGNISALESKDLQEMITRRIKSTFKMIGLNEPIISFTETLTN